MYKNGLNIANRMDRLPISSVHKKIIIALAVAYFFEFADLNTFSYAAPALVKQWHLPLNTIAIINSSAFLGMFIGATAGGWLGDKAGRKKSIIISLVLLSLFSALNALSWDIWSLAIFRFVTGMASSSLLVNANTYIIEFFPKAVRGKYQGLAVAIGITGIPITGYVSTWIIPIADYGWRLVFVWGALGIFALFGIVKLFELPRWYEMKGQVSKAKETLEQIEKIVAYEKGPLAKPEPEVMIAPVTTGRMSDIFKGIYLKRTIILICVWILQTIAFYGFGSWVPTLLVKQGIGISHSLLYSTLITLGAPLGSLTGAMISDRFERKTNIIVSCFFIAIAVFLFGATLNPTMIVVFGFLINYIERTFSSNLYTYTSELYGTEVRSFGQGLTYGIGRASNVIGPFIISFVYTGFGYFNVFILISVVWAATAVAIFFGPRTSKRSLEEINGTQSTNTYSASSNL
ncbi:putative MFS transporter [Neobacillus bataviensis]|uniref:Putative MFS transporter n=1 Tax=Neobacillus bataviensis TaxID=220685 RepID=A0A561CEP3_9BACI|nr:MFS transporter [Neobacillus bataviensis]TWD89646.1 putative MFS transporter [Neobacillus bataviensis]